MSTFAAEELVEACAAGYVPRTHPDMRYAIATLGVEKANEILATKTSEHDAIQRRVSGCYGSSHRR